MKSTVLTIPGKLARVTLAETKGFSDKDIEKIKQALCVLSYVINSEAFMWAVISYKQPNGTPTFSSTNDLRIDVYNKLLISNELGTTGDDNELDFSLQYYNSWWSRVLGYTLPKQMWIWMNWKYHTRFSPAQMAGNLAHEWTHKLGYDHRSATEYTSVPYAIGYIVEELGKRYESQAIATLMDKIEIVTSKVGA